MITSYTLHYGDQFSIIDKVYFITPALHNKEKFQIVDVKQTEKKWYEFWKPQYTYVTLRYLGEGATIEI